MRARRVFTKAKRRTRYVKSKPCKVLSKDDPEYWEALLRRNKLSQSRGTSRKLSYGHTVTDLDYDGVNTYRIEERFKDTREWPLSL